MKRRDIAVFLTLVLLAPQTPAAPPSTRQILDIDLPVSGESTTLWSPGFQRCWDEVRAMFNLELIGLETPTSKALDRFRWNAKTTIPVGASVAVVGGQGQKFVEQANRLLGAAFGPTAPLLNPDHYREPEDDPPGGVACYTAMRRHLAFAVPFQNYGKALAFQSGEDLKMQVQYFGSFGMHRPKYADMAWVLAYEPGRRIALRLRLQQADEAMFLLMDDGVRSIGDAIEQIRTLGGNANEPSSPLDENDTLLIPSIDLSHRENFLPLLNGEFRSEKTPVALRFSTALQSVDLELNEKGVEMETRSFLIPPDFLSAGGRRAPLGEDIARSLVFDRPFYLLLWRKGGTHPYLAAHVVRGGLRPMR